MELALILFGLLVFSGCSKDEFTKPSQVVFEFKMNKTSSAGKFLQFQEGTFRFNALEFDGERESGGDVFFTAPFSDPIYADLESGTTSETVSFDIPQGIYQHIQVSFEIGEDDQQSAISYDGVYQSARGNDIPVRVEINFAGIIPVNAKSASGGNQIVLNKDLNNVAEITLDPVFLFQLVNSRTLESASVTNLDGVATILINENSNEVIYNRLINRLEQSTFAVFK